MRIAAKTNSPASPKHFSWRGVVVLLLALLVTSLATPSFAAQTTTAQTATKSHTRARHHRAHHVRAKYRTHHRAHARSHRARAKKSVTAPKAAVAHVSQPAAPVKSAPAAFARTSAKTAPATPALAKTAPAHQARTPAPAPPPTPAHQAVQTSQAVADSNASQAPRWPANDRPSPAAITWDGHGLRIAATNASLHQILDQVASETGTKVEGMGADERIFGEFGPGQARDVLAQLLHGSGYNFLLVGDQGLGTPRQVILSARRSTTTPGAANRAAANPNADSDDDASDAEPEEPQPLPRPAFVDSGAPRTPQEMQQRVQQEMQQRIQQEQQNEQNQNQNQPPQNQAPQ